MTDSSSHRPAILCDLIYSSAEPGHGGRHRSLQLREMVEEAGFEPHVMPIDCGASNLSCYIEGLKAALRFRIRPGQGWRWARRWGRNAVRFQQAFATGKAFRALFWENSRPVGYLSPLLAKEAGLPVFATPQNVEALAGGHAVMRPSDYPLREICVEMEALRRADSVHAICQAEQWFMAWHGVQAGFLPYHPPSPIQRQMLDVRERRAHAPKSGRLLMMGTTTNPPTRQGMLIALAALSAVPADSPPLDVIGTGTETLRAEFSHPRFHFHGRVSSERLDELLTGAKATIVHQPLAIGALTRIAEMLMSGLPVLANPIAARSTGHHHGVYVFEDEAALNALCAADLPMPPVPAVPELVRSAIRSLQKLAGGSPERR